MSKRIAIIGSGISGLVSAHLLSYKYEVSLFEANAYLGGHTHTVDVAPHAIDTGFIVFNKKTYPNFCQLLDKLNVAVQLSEMSFSYHASNYDFEYNGCSINTLFAQRRNLLNPMFYRLLKDIVEFNRDAKKFILSTPDPTLSIQNFLAQHKYSTQFINCYLLPMLASIWSKNTADALGASAYFIFKFYDNHGLLDIYNRPPWYVIKGGSRAYVPALIAKFKDRAYLNTKINRIIRHADHVVLQGNSFETQFDAVVIATHSDQALQMLTHPTNAEVSILSRIKYNNNAVTLHTDEKVMPKRKRAWASWNYKDLNDGRPSLTYYMNRLQGLDTPTNFFVSMNLADVIDSNKIIQSFNYAHPCVDVAALQAQQQRDLINGKHNTYYVGSYWGHGFHEDGVNSAMHTVGLITAEN